MGEFRCYDGEQAFTLMGRGTDVNKHAANSTSKHEYLHISSYIIKSIHKYIFEWRIMTTVCRRSTKYTYIITCVCDDVYDRRSPSPSIASGKQ